MLGTKRKCFFWWNMGFTIIIKLAYRCRTTQDVYLHNFTYQYFLLHNVQQGYPEQGPHSNSIFKFPVFSLSNRKFSLCQLQWFPVLGMQGTVTVPALELLIFWREGFGGRAIRSGLTLELHIKIKYLPTIVP